MTTDISQEGLSRWREEMFAMIALECNRIKDNWLMEGDIIRFNVTGQLIYRT
jgi:hypothetical protein